MRRADIPGLLLLAERPQIGPIVLNCTLRELHGANYEMTSMPVEDGSRLTDHRIRMPIEVEIEGVISPRGDTFPGQFDPGLFRTDDPLIDVLDPDRGSERLDPVASAWSKLRAYADSNSPSEVFTALEVYEDMLPVSLVHEEAGTDAIVFTMRLRQVQIARNRNEQFVSPDFESRVRGPDDLGQQGTRELSAQELEQVTGFTEIVEVAA